MSPEKDIVNLWLNRQGFFTVSDINANNRVADFVAIRQRGQVSVQHVELHCSVSPASAVGTQSTTSNSAGSSSAANPDVGNNQNFNIGVGAGSNGIPSNGADVLIVKNNNQLISNAKAQGLGQDDGTYNDNNDNDNNIQI